MPGENNNTNKGVMDAYKTIAVNFLIPLVFLMLSFITAWLHKVDDRMYALQQSAVTDSKLDTTERRIVNYLDTRLVDLNSKMDIVIRHLEMSQRRQEEEMRRGRERDYD